MGSCETTCSSCRARSIRTPSSRTRSGARPTGSARSSRSTATRRSGSSAGSRRRSARASARRGRRADPKGLEIGVELIGTPAEESGGGKIDLLDAGVFKQVEAVLSSHPSGSPEWETTSVSLGIVAKRVAFKGVASHAAFSPDLGKNALNAVIRLFVGVDGWRQHMPRDARVHGVITHGGGPAHNIVPACAECVFRLRAKTQEELDGMVRTFEGIARGAALQTETEVTITDEMRLYAPTAPNERTGELLREELRARGAEAVPGVLVLASPDFGN